MAAHRFWRLLCHSHQTDATAFAIAEIIGRTVSGGAQALVAATPVDVIVNGSFAANSNWTLANATISGGVCNVASGANFLDAAAPPLTIGATYSFSFDYNKTAGSKLRVANGATGGTNIVYTSAVLANGSGTLTGTFVATGTHFRIEADTAVYSGTIDNVSCLPVYGATASTTSGAQTPSLAFDGNAATYWLATSGVDGQWIMFDLGASNAKDIIEIVITARNDTSFYTAPNWAEWQFSDDGVTWTPYIYVMPSLAGTYTTGSSKTFSGGHQYISKTNLSVNSRKASGALIAKSNLGITSHRTPGPSIVKTNLAITSRPSSAWAVISKTNIAITSAIISDLRKRAAQIFG